MNKEIKIGLTPAMRYGIALGIGLVIGLNVIPHPLVATVYALIGALCVFYALQNNLKKLFTLLPYIIYSEIVIRVIGHAIPYLFAQYLLGSIFLLLLLHNSKIKVHSKAFFLMFFFTLIEIIESYHTEDVMYSRLLITNTAVLAILVIWGSFNFLTPNLINIFLKHLKYASIFLCGIVLIAHLKGQINYGAESNAAATNGLAPVQLSAYLGFSCAVFFLTIMNNERPKEIFLNVSLFCITAVIMVLSFSRGGLYFMGAFVAVYIFFNRTKMKKFFLLLFLIPIGAGVYFYVTRVTKGLIEQRYEQKGSSGRDLLIIAGYKLFIANPVTGVGTGNFNTEIRKQNLYDYVSGAHNEFIRAAAEHGVPGLITYWGFFLFLIFEIMQRQKIEREYACYFLLFFIMITIHNGLKISLQPMLLLLAVATPSLKRIKKTLHVPVEKKLTA